MKTHILSNCAFWALLAWAIASCGNKDYFIVQDPYPLGIAIYHPKDGDLLKTSVEISADVFYDVLNERVHEVSVKITRDSDNAVVFQESPSISNFSNFYSYYYLFTPVGLTGPTPMTLTIYGKGSGESSSKSVKFTVQP